MQRKSLQLNLVICTPDRPLLVLQYRTQVSSLCTNSVVEWLDWTCYYITDSSTRHYCIYSCRQDMHRLFVPQEISFILRQRFIYKVLSTPQTIYFFIISVQHIHIYYASRSIATVVICKLFSSVPTILRIEITYHIITIHEEWSIIYTASIVSVIGRLFVYKIFS